MSGRASSTILHVILAVAAGLLVAGSGCEGERSMPVASGPLSARGDAREFPEDMGTSPDAGADAGELPMDPDADDEGGERTTERAACEADEDCHALLGPASLCLPDGTTTGAGFCHPSCIEVYQDRTFGCWHDGHCCGDGECIEPTPAGGTCRW